MPTVTDPQLITRTEIAELSGVSLNAVNKSLEQKIAKAKRTHGRTLLAAQEAAALALIADVPLGMSIKLKKEVRNWVVHTGPKLADELELSPALRIAMTESAAEVARRAAEYVRLRDTYVDVDPGVMAGTPVIRGTRVPVRTLAQLLEGGEGREAIREDYPHIPEEAYEAAVLWARGNPRRGRPPAGGRGARVRRRRRRAEATRAGAG